MPGLTVGPEKMPQQRMVSLLEYGFGLQSSFQVGAKSNPIS